MTLTIEQVLSTDSLCQNKGKNPIRIPRIQQMPISFATFLLEVDPFKGKLIDCNMQRRENEI
jgi:hypothetical protein